MFISLDSNIIRNIHELPWKSHTATAFKTLQRKTAHSPLTNSAQVLLLSCNFFFSAPHEALLLSAGFPTLKSSCRITSHHLDSPHPFKASCQAEIWSIPQSLSCSQWTETFSPSHLAFASLLIRESLFSKNK